MNGFVQHLYLFFAHLGVFGLLLLGVLDSSFLFMPLGNDLLMIGLTASHHQSIYFYVPAAAFGSTLGCFLLDLICRKGGEEGLKKMMKPKRLEYLKKKISDNAMLALSVASLAPPPFPFTPVVAAASAFEYPRWKLLSTIFVARVVRFTIVGLLAIWFGRRILSFAKSPAFVWGMGIFIGLCVAGSGFSIWQWVQRARSKGR